MRSIIPAAIVAALVAAGSATAASVITSAQIQDGTIRARDMKLGAVTTNRLAPEVQAMLTKAGQPGPQGERGPAGRDGIGVSGYEVVEQTTDWSGSRSETVTCPAGKVAIGGGLKADQVRTVGSYPSDLVEHTNILGQKVRRATSWTITGESVGPETGVQTFVVCIVA